MGGSSRDDTRFNTRRVDVRQLNTMDVSSSLIWGVRFAIISYMVSDTDSGLLNL